MTRHKARNRKGFNLSSSNSEAIGHRARRRFNLIEAAIVLAVVGVVLGGIWWAADAVRANVNRGRLEKGLIQGIYKLRELAVPADYTNWPNLCGTTEIFPKGDFPIVNNKIQTPLGIVATVAPMSGSGLICIGNATEIIVRFAVKNGGECQKITSQILARFKNSNDLIRISIIGNDNAIKQYIGGGTQLLPHQITSCLLGPNPPSIRLHFSYARTN